MSEEKPETNHHHPMTMASTTDNNSNHQHQHNQPQSQQLILKSTITSNTNNNNNHNNNNNNNNNVNINNELLTSPSSSSSSSSSYDIEETSPPSSGLASSSSSPDSDSDVDYSCGIYRFHPKYLQRYANKNCFLILFCLTSVLQGVYYTYFVSVLTTIEKLYQVPSQTTGLIMSSTEIGQIGGALFLTYYGGQGHRPRWIATGMLVFSFAALLCSTPHYLFGSQPIKVFNNNDNNKLSSSSLSSSASIASIDALPLAATLKSSSSSISLCNLDNRTSSSLSSSSSLLLSSCSEESEHFVEKSRITNSVLGIFFMSLLMIGLGTTAVNTLGIPYIDDNVAPKDSPLYFGITIGVRIFGPVCGFLLGSFCTSIPVQFPFGKSDLNPSDPNWIGAWWLGLFLIGIALSLASFPMMIFPKKLRKPDPSSYCHQQQQQQQQQKQNRSLKQKHQQQQNGQKETEDDKEVVKKLLNNNNNNNNNNHNKNHKNHNNNNNNNELNNKTSTELVTFCDNNNKIINNHNNNNNKLSFVAEVKLSSSNNDLNDDDDDDDDDEKKIVTNCINNNNNKDDANDDGNKINNNKKQRVNNNNKNKKLKTAEKNNSDNNNNEKNTRSLIGFTLAIKRILNNDILLCRTASSVLHILPISGLYTFLPKYFESQFQLTATKANIICGLAGILIMGIGVFASGMFMRKFTPNARFVAGWIAFVALAYVLGMIVLMFLGCRTTTFAGFKNPGEDHFVMANNEKLECSSNCQCQPRFQPICMGNGITYTSPCLAGCSTSLNSSSNTIYVNCLCSPDSETIAKPGICPLECNTLIFYIVIFAIINLLHSTSEVGSMMLTLRSVEPRDKAMALGFISFAISLFGNVPCPIIYGSIVDSACLFWEEDCGKRGACRLYDSTKFRKFFHGLTALIMFLAFCIDLIVFLKASKIELNEVTIKKDDDDDDNNDKKDKNGKKHDDNNHNHHQMIMIDNDDDDDIDDIINNKNLSSSTTKTSSSK